MDFEGFYDAKHRFSEVHKRVPRQAKSPHCMFCVSNVFKAHTASVQTCGTSILGSCGTNPKKFWTQPCATSGLEKDLMRSYSHVILISYNLFMYCSHCGIKQCYWLMAEGPWTCTANVWLDANCDIFLSFQQSPFQVANRTRTRRNQRNVAGANIASVTVSWTQNIFHGTVGPVINLLDVRRCCFLSICFKCMM